MSARVLIHVVTFNNESTISKCLTSLLNLASKNEIKILVSDNSSSDNTLALIKEFAPQGVEIIANKLNLGFCSAHNFGATYALQNSYDHLLIINPDLVVKPEFLDNLLSFFSTDSSAGMACPKLYRADENLEPSSPLRLDACGMFITPEIRHFDRGSNELEQGKYEDREYVFGGSGAALLLKKDFIVDVALNKDELLKANFAVTALLFDPVFFAYREDADLSWRAQILGWNCLYEPTAIGYHQRKVLPTNREELPKELNAYSVKNRFLLQLNNLHPLGNLSIILTSLWRNILVVAAVILKEKDSLPALKTAYHLRKQARINFKKIHSRRRRSHREINQLFSDIPYSNFILEKSPTPSTIKTLTIIVVNYNSENRLAECVKSINKTVSDLKNKFEFQIVVFDNNSSDHSARQLKPLLDTLPHYELFISQQNIGFAGAINRSARLYSADAFLILNPDVGINAEAIRLLIEDLENFPALAAVTPKLIGKDNKQQLRFILKAFPSLFSTISEFFFLHKILPRNPWTTAYELARDKYFLKKTLQTKNQNFRPNREQDKPMIVSQPPAACMLIRAEDFFNVKGFDTNFYPAWFEDVDFCKELSLKARLCAINLKAQVLHEGGYSAKTMSKIFFYEMWYRNMLKYWQKHGKNYEYLCLKILLPFALLLRGGVFTATGLKELIVEKKTVGLRTAAGLFFLAFKSISF
ncbi:MAG: glycosyltransferase [Proteobacteria bacterium]|nr:glycosyltransferase [Pseudomonadota bacterium]